MPAIPDVGQTIGDTDDLVAVGFGMFDDMMNDPAQWSDRPRVRRVAPGRTVGLPAAEYGVA